MAFTSAAFTSAASRLSARLHENLAESARDLGLQSLEGFTSAGVRHLESTTLHTDAGIKEIRKLLESAPAKDADRIEGLRRVLALMAKGKPVSEFFPLVANCLSSSSPAVRSLVAIYIVRQAALEPDTALLAVNIYQKNLTDPNPHNRGTALRVLSSLGLESISELVIMVLAKSSRDGNPYVRRMAAVGIEKIFRQDSAYLDSIIQPLSTLLGDRSAVVVGQAFSTFLNICPRRLDLIHPHYRAACKSLPDADEWGQISILHTLVRYCRVNFADPSTTETLDSDLELLLNQSQYLLTSRNPAVVMAVVSLYANCAPHSHLNVIVRPILRLLHSPPEITYVILHDILILANAFPDIFSSYAPQFFIRSDEPSYVKRRKVQCLAAIVDENNVDSVFKELLHCVTDSDEELAGSAVTVIGECARRQPQISDKCIDVLIALTSSSSLRVVTQVIMVLQSLFRYSESSGNDKNKNIIDPLRKRRANVIFRLMQILISHQQQHQQSSKSSRLKYAHAWAMVYYMVGEYASSDGFLDTFAPDTLRYGAKSFSTEPSPTVKIQIVLMAAKILILSYLSPSSQHLTPITLLFEHITNLARYDIDYQVRDRARFIKGLVLSGPPEILNSLTSKKSSSSTDEQEDVDNNQQGLASLSLQTGESIKNILFASSYSTIILSDATTPNDQNTPSASSDLTQLSKFSLITGRRQKFLSRHRPYLPIPDWTTSPSSPSIRSSTTSSNNQPMLSSQQQQQQSSTSSLSSYSTKRQQQPSPFSSSSIIGAATTTKSLSNFKGLDDFLSSSHDGEIGIVNVSAYEDESSGDDEDDDDEDDDEEDDEEDDEDDDEDDDEEDDEEDDDDDDEGEEDDSGEDDDEGEQGEESEDDKDERSSNNGTQKPSSRDALIF